MTMYQRISQIIFTILYNFYLYGFFSAGIYQGKLKMIPCPGFNCHSCPAALLVCPIGALQLFAAYGKNYVSLYVIGILGIIGSIGGRIVCGWACPFGFLQDLLHKIPSPKINIPRFLEPIRYGVLFGCVVYIAYLTKEPWFCKAVCPVGTLEAGIPLVLLSSDLRELVDSLFCIKVIVLAGFLIWMVMSSRPFCRIVCPLGAFYGLFNRVSLLQISCIKEKCNMDKKCGRICPVGHRMYEDDTQAARCIRCLRCKICPANAIKIGFKRKNTIANERT